MDGEWLVAPAIGQFVGKDGDTGDGVPEVALGQATNAVALGAACAIAAEEDSPHSYIIADTQHQCLRRVKDGVVSHLAGKHGVIGFADGAESTFSDPCGLVADPSTGTLYVADTGNHALRTVDLSTGVVATLCGGPSPGYRDGDIKQALFRELCDVKLMLQAGDGQVDSWLGDCSIEGAGSTIIIADTGNNCIRAVVNGVVKTLAGSPTSGHNDGVATEARFCHPSGLAVDGDGFIYVADTDNHCIRRLSSDGTVITYAGDGVAGCVDGPRHAARFSHPCSITIGPSGSLLVADTGSHSIREVTGDGVVRTVAGSTTAGYSDGFGTVSRFCSPCFVACMPSGAVFTTEHGCCIIRALVRLPALHDVVDDALSPHVGTSTPRAMATPLTPANSDDAVGSPSDTHSDRFSALVDNPEFCDVAFRVDGAILTACRAVLAAQSDYFRVLLYGPLSEGVRVAATPRRDFDDVPKLHLKLPSRRPAHPDAGAGSGPDGEPDLPPPRTPTVPKRIPERLSVSVTPPPPEKKATTTPGGLPIVDIPGCSMDAFRVVVSYLTTNRLNVALEHSVETVALADQYGLSRLSKLLMRFIARRVDVENAIPMLIQANQLCLDAVQDICLDFVKANRALVSAHESFAELALHGHASLAVTLARVFATTPTAASGGAILFSGSPQPDLKRKRVG